MGSVKGKNPQGFTVSMAVMDCIPVLCFSLMISVLSLRFHSMLFYIGAFLVILAGALKCLWKFIVAITGKNIYPLFIQMRIVMPVGFVMIIAALILGRANLSPAAIWHQMSSLPAAVFYVLGLIGMCAMSVFAVKLDPADPKSNWIEQATNGAAQLCFLIAVCCC